MRSRLLKAAPAAGLVPLALLVYSRLKRPVPLGVAYSEATGVDALLVTLRKEERDFAPSTRYRDYPISAELFHWETQNSTTLASAPGRRYTEGGSRVLLFVRAFREDELGSSPYLCLGEVSHVENQGERPISITWRLHRPMPQDLLSKGLVEAG